MLKRVVVLFAIAAFVLAVPVYAADNGQICGTAKDQNQKSLAGVTVQLRNSATGQLAGTTKSDDSGAFCFAGLPAGNFVIEIVDAAGRIIGTSAPVALTAAAMSVSGLAVSATAAGAVTAAAAGGGAGGFFGSTAGILLLVGAGAVAVVGVVAATNDASASK